jgi:hypothetical protein
MSQCAKNQSSPEGLACDLDLVGDLPAQYLDALFNINAQKKVWILSWLVGQPFRWQEMSAKH